MHGDLNVKHCVCFYVLKYIIVRTGIVEHRYFRTMCSSNLKGTLNIKKIYDTLTPTQRLLHTEIKLKQLVFSC